MLLRWRVVAALQEGMLVDSLLNGPTAGKGSQTYPTTTAPLPYVSQAVVRTRQMWLVVAADLKHTERPC